MYCQQVICSERCTSCDWQSSRIPFTMSCKFAARSPLRRRKNYAFFLSIVLLCTLAWLRLAELESGYTPLRPLLDAESEARRLLAFITHYNYQCNTTAGPIGNWSLWPVCIGREAGLNLDSKDMKLMYTIGYIHYFVGFFSSVVTVSETET